MIFYTGRDEKINFFYFENSYASRQHFIQLIRADIDSEIHNFRMECTRGEQFDLELLFKEINKESHFHIDRMANEFICNAQAYIDRYISLVVEERDIQEV